MSYVMNILNNLELIETRMRDIYAALARRFADNEPYRNLFRNLSQEEEHHADQIRYQKRLVRQNPGDFSHVSVDMEGMDEILAFLEHLQENPPTATEAEALRLTIDMESISQERMYRSVIVESCPGLKPLIENLTRFDKDHLYRLNRFAEEQLPGEIE